MSSGLLENASSFLDVLSCLHTGQANDVGFHLDGVGDDLDLSLGEQFILQIEPIIKVREADWSVRHDHLVARRLADDNHALLLNQALPLSRVVLIRTEPTELLRFLHRLTLLIRNVLQLFPLVSLTDRERGLLEQLLPVQLALNEVLPGVFLAAALGSQQMRLFVLLKVE